MTGTSLVSVRRIQCSTSRPELPLSSVQSSTTTS